MALTSRRKRKLAKSGSKMAKVKVTRKGTGWLIDFYGSDPETRYLPPDAEYVEKQVRREERKARRGEAIHQ